VESCLSENVLEAFGALLNSTALFWFEIRGQSCIATFIAKRELVELILVQILHHAQHECVIDKERVLVFSGSAVLDLFGQIE